MADTLIDLKKIKNKLQISELIIENIKSLISAFSKSRLFFLPLEADSVTFSFSCLTGF